MLRSYRRLLQFISHSCSVWGEERYSRKTALRALMYASNSATSGIRVEAQIVQQFAFEKPRLMKMTISFTFVYCTKQINLASSHWRFHKNKQKPFHRGNPWSCPPPAEAHYGSQSNGEDCDETESVTPWALIGKYFLERANSEHLVDTNTHRQMNRNRHTNRCRLCLTIELIHLV